MALNSAAVDVAVTGAVSYGPVGSTAPTDSKAALDVAYMDVGYLNSDGVKESRDRSTTNVVAWQHSDVVRAVITESSITITFVMIETKKESVELFYGAPVNATDGSIEIRPASTGGRKSMVVDYIDGVKYARMHLPQAEVMEVGELTIGSGDAVAYEVTVTGYPDPITGYSAKKWWSALDTTP